MYILIIAKYLCTFCVYMYVHVGGCTCTFVHAVTRGSCHRFLCSSPPYFLGQDFSQNLALTRTCGLDCQQTPGVLLSLLPQD